MGMMSAFVPSMPLPRSTPGQSASSQLRKQLSHHRSDSTAPTRTLTTTITTTTTRPATRQRRCEGEISPVYADLSAPPPFHESAADSSDNTRSLHWKDRVALYAQFSAEETLEALLCALRTNNRSGPRKDDGIDALYVFANLDIWAISHRFFGKKMDLGQFERFKRVVVADPYDILLRQYETRTLSAIHVKGDVYVTRRAFVHNGEEKVFTFTMCRTEFGSVGGRAWMVDSIIYDEDNAKRLV